MLMKQSGGRMLLTDRWLAFLPIGASSVEPATLSGLTGGTAWACLPVGGARVWADVPGPRPVEQQPLHLVDTVRGSLRRAQGWTRPMTTDDLQEALQVFTEIKADGPARLTISSDLLGLRPVFLHRAADGWWLSNRIELLHQATRMPRRGDKQAALEFFFLLAPLGRRTLEAGIERLYCGDVVRWSAEEGPVLDARGLDVAVPVPDPDDHLDLAVSILHQTLTASFDRKRAWHAQPPVIALSGGYDSRIVAALFTHRGERPRAYTYGMRHHRELFGARRVARALNLPLAMVPYPHDMLRSRLPLWLELLQGQADPHVMHLANLLAMPEPDGTAVAHGFLGDALSGALLSSLPAEAFTGVEALADSIVKRFAFPAVVRLAEAAGFVEPLAALRQSVLNSLRQGVGSIGQTAILWNLENRQRRFIATQADILGPRFAPFYPFYDRAYIEAWLARPLMAHTGRTLLSEFFQRCFPELTAIPHPSESRAINPTLRGMLKQFAEDRFYELTDAVSSRLSSSENRHPDIMRLSYGGETPDIRRAMAGTVAAASARLDAHFGLGAPGDLLGLCFPDGTVVHDGLHALRRLWALAEYAGRAGETSAAQPVRAASAA